MQSATGLLVDFAASVLDVEDVALAQLGVLFEHGGDGAFEIACELVGDDASDFVADVEGVAFGDGAIQASGDGMFGQLDFEITTIIMIIDIFKFEAATERLRSCNGAEGYATKKTTTTKMN